MHKEIPHSSKVGNLLFQRTVPIHESSTNFLLPCFAQWFIEQAFKSGPDPLARKSIEDMTKSEFGQQWGNNLVNASQLYGASDNITNAIRLKKFGKLKVQKVKVGNQICDFPPKLTFKTKDIQDDEVSQSDVNMLYPKDWSQEQAEERLYALGHPRFNNHFGLVLIQTFWIREHNTICDMLLKNHSDWDDERIFHTARLIVIAELSKYVIEDYIQHIANLDLGLKFDPTLVHGTNYQFYNRAHFEFNFLYRWHSMVPDSLVLNGKELPYKDLVWAPKVVSKFGLKTLLEYASELRMTRVGLHNTADFLRSIEVTTLLHTRCLKTKSYNEYREFFGYQKAKDFSDITKDKMLAEELKTLYQDVKNVDWYVGVLAEDHPANAMTGELMQTQIQFYAFSAIYSNPLFSKENWTVDVLTKEGMDRINSTRLSDFFNDNLQENGGMIFMNESKNQKYDCFKPRKISKEVKEVKEKPYKMSDSRTKMRKAYIEESKTLYPIDNKKSPIHLDDSHMNVNYLLKKSLEANDLVFTKHQLLQIFKALIASVHTRSLVTANRNQFDVLIGILSSKDPFLSDEETLKFIKTLDFFKPTKESQDYIDKIYGTISKFFSKTSVDRYKDCLWNRDEVFGEFFLNGPDPTQLAQLTDLDLQREFSSFTSIVSYFEKRFKKKFKEELENGNFYYINLYESMQSITSDGNVARPRSVFYYDNSTSKLLPIGIQLNNRIRTNIKVTVLSGKNLEKMDLLSLTDPFIEVECGKVKKRTKILWNTSNPKWNEVFEFTVDPQDNLSFKLYDADLFSNQFMTGFNVKMEKLLPGKNELSVTTKGGGQIFFQIEFKENKKISEDRIFTPQNTNWSIAKLFMSNAFINHYQIVNHHFKCHSMLEAVKLVMHHSLYFSHPVFKLLSPHLYNTDVINLVNRKTLLNPNGKGLYSFLYSGGIDNQKIVDYQFDHFNFSHFSFPEIMKMNGTSQIPSFYFGKDGQKIWDSVYKYVESILKYHYKNEDFSCDAELMNFFTSLENYRVIKRDNVTTMDKEQQPKIELLDPVLNLPKRTGFFSAFDSVAESDIFESVRGRESSNLKKKKEPSLGFTLETLHDITHMLSTFIFNAIALHTIYHDSQLECLSFTPLAPTIMNMAPPLFDDKSFGPLKEDGYTLNPQQQKIISEYLPSMGQSILLNSIYGQYNSDFPLINEKYNLFNHEPCIGYFLKFQKEMTAIRDEIKKRNTYTYLSKMSQSINV